MKKIALNVAGFFVAIVAVLFNLPTLYLMAAILWLMPVISYGMGWLTLFGLTVERQESAHGEVGERVRLTLTLTNRGRFPKFFLLARDTLPKGVRAVEGGSPLILQLPPGKSGTVVSLVEPERRGVFRLGPVQVFSTDPLGLQTFTQTVPGSAELLVYPSVIPAEASWLTGAAARGWRGQENALTHGGGTDFYGVRDYQPGDELRRVHWRTTARTGRLAVAEYTQGLALEAVIALDLNKAAYQGTGDGPDSALEVAVTLAASLLTDLMRQGHSARLLTASTLGSEGAEAASGIRAGDQRLRFMETLAWVEATSDLTLADVLARDQKFSQRETTLVYITPNAQDARLAGALADWGARGAGSMGFALDADSFRGQGRKGGVSDAALPPTLRLVQRGDDLRQILEGGRDARSR